MAVITIKINNKNYQIDCEENEVPKLQNICGLLEERIKKIRDNFSDNLSTEMVYLFTMIMMQEELNKSKSSSNKEKEYSKLLEDISEYIEKITDKLD